MLAQWHSLDMLKNATRLTSPLGCRRHTPRIVIRNSDCEDMLLMYLHPITAINCSSFGKAQTHNTQPGPCTVIRVMEMSPVLRGSRKRAVSEQLGTKLARFWMRSPCGDLIHSVDQQPVHNLGCEQVNLLLAGLYSLPRHELSVIPGWGREGRGWGSVGPT